MAGTWFGEVPILKGELHLDDGELGLALLALAVASLVGMHVAGRTATRLGSGPVARGTGVLLPIALVMPALAGSFGWFVVAVLPFGLLQGLVDVVQNTHGVTVQRRLGMPIMSRLHAAWGVGGITGSVLAFGAVSVGLSPLQHLAWLAVVGSGSLLVLLRTLLPGDVDAGTQGPGPSRSGWTRRILLLGALGASCMAAQASIGSWAGVFLIEVRGASVAVGSLAFAPYLAMLTAGRLVGDWLHRRLGSVLLLQSSVVVALTGLGVALGVHTVAAGLVGFGVFGVGLSVLVPLFFSAAGAEGAAPRYPGVALAVANYTTLSYLGLLIGPAAIGVLARGVGLTWALSVIVVVVGLVAAGARSVAPEQ